MDFVNSIDNGSPIKLLDPCFKIEKEHNSSSDPDSDVACQSEILNETLLNAYNSVQSHLITVKKRMIEEKEIAMMEAERVYLNNYDKLQAEIATLKADISCKEGEISKNTNGFSLLSEKSACLIGNLSRKYSSSTSISKIFRAWSDQTLATKRSEHLDKVAQAFARKHLLAKYFYSMCLSVQRHKLCKINAEAKFKFDSVTTEMVTSYETELENMRSDLKEAYLTIEAEQLRRRQLEEDLRGMFLKNMTAMNFEALSLFQNAHNMVDAGHGMPGVFSSTARGIAGSAAGVGVASPPRPVRRDLMTPVTTTSPGRSTGSGGGSRSPIRMQRMGSSDSFLVGSSYPASYVSQLSSSYHSTLATTPHLAHHSPPSTTPLSTAGSAGHRHFTPSTPSSVTRHSRIPPGSSGSRSATSPSSTTGTTTTSVSHRRPFH